jgi:hypothetical protein
MRMVIIDQVAFCLLWDRRIRGDYEMVFKRGRG